MAFHSLADLDEILGHPVAGMSWEGFAIENLLAVLPAGTPAGFYRTTAGAEIDLVVDLGKRRYAIEIKRSTAPTLGKGFHLGAADIEAIDKLVVQAGAASFPLGDDAQALSLADALARFGAKPR